MKRIMIFIAILAALLFTANANATVCQSTDLSSAANRFHQAVESFAAQFTLGQSHFGQMYSMQILDERVNELRGYAQCLAATNRDKDALASVQGCNVLEGEVSAIQRKISNLNTNFNLDSSTYRAGTMKQWQEVVKAYEELRSAING
jgi:hypothetical protein